MATKKAKPKKLATSKPARGAAPSSPQMKTVIATIRGHEFDDIADMIGYVHDELDGEMELEEIRAILLKLSGEGRIVQTCKLID